MELVTRTLELLGLEHDAELAESLNNRSNCSIRELEQEGLCLTKLLMSSAKTGLFGRVLIKLKKEFAALPPHKFTPGDIVGVFTADIKNPDFSGTVYKVSLDFIVIACEETIEVEGKVSIVALANEATYKRQKQVMERLGSLSNRENSYNLAQVLIGESPPRFKNTGKTIEFCNESLNSGQQQAVSFALDKCLDVSVIHGPPGTGKTTTIIEIILQAVKRGIKVLATAPSNIAVDNLVEKLAGKVKVVRLGHPARMMESITKYSFDSMLKKTDQYEISSDIRKEINKLGKNRNTRNEVNALRKELKQRDKKASEEVLERCEVVLATCISSGGRVVEEFSKKISGFGMIVIDEAAQALECACWVPILLGTKVVLAGDHKQLPPTIKSEQAAKAGLSVSLMERICERYPESTFLLETQYRMHEEIMRWSNSEFYQGRLIADESVRQRLLEDYPYPLVLIDTSGGGLYEAGVISKYNPSEAEIVINFCNELKALGVNDISVITPYNAQVEILRNSLENIEIASVDGFQGREKNVVVISLVRSNENADIGFLKEFRRLNVAITRAKMMVCMVMDCDTIGGKKSPGFLQTLCQYFREHAHCLNFQEYCTGGIAVRPRKEEKTAKKIQKVKEKKIEELRSSRPERQRIEKNLDVLPDTKKSIHELLNSSENEFKTLKLDAKQRHEVHELCQKLQLYHKSTGSGKNKCMIISKIFPAKAVSNAKVYELLKNRENSSESEAEEEKSATKVPTKLKNPVQKKEDNYDEDAFLAQAMIEASSCMYKGCGKNITILGRSCKFCNAGFCMNHILAEVHGCGDKARVEARRVLQRPPKISEEKIDMLKDRLQDKIKSQQTRNPKKKKSKK